MMGQTDRHFRYMISLLAKDVRLYTPMIHADAIVYSEKKFIKNENHNQKDVGIQIAGSDPDIMASAAKIIEQHNDMTFFCIPILVTRWFLQHM